MSCSDRFEELYKGSSSGHGQCFGNLNVGMEYVCPQVSEGGIKEQGLDPWFASQAQPASTDCFGEGQNMGYNVGCGIRHKRVAKTKNQSGGARVDGNIGAKCINYKNSSECSHGRRAS